MKLNTDKLEKIRLALELDYGEFAKKIGLSRQRYYVILNGYGNPTMKTINQISRKLSLTEEEIIIFER